MIKDIKFTDKALKQINTLLSKKDKGSFFRIAIKGGGCSGFQYEFTFDQSKAEDDLNYDRIHHNLPYTHSKNLHLHVRMEYDPNHVPDLNFQLNLH